MKRTCPQVLHEGILIHGSTWCEGDCPLGGILRKHVQLFSSSKLTTAHKLDKPRLYTTMAEFSSAMKLVDLDDFITPSQACVKPEVYKPSGTNASESTIVESAKITLNDCLACRCVHAHTNNTPTTHTTHLHKHIHYTYIHACVQARKISSSTHSTTPQPDTFFCSGCITSAETVLITAQSTAEFFTSLNAAKQPQTPKGNKVTLRVVRSCAFWA